ASLRLTGELADGWLPIFLVPERMDAAIEELRAGADAAGRTIDDVAFSPQVSAYVTTDRAAARDRERRHMAFYLGGMGVFYHRYFLRIVLRAEAGRVGEAYLAGDQRGAAQLVTDEMVDATAVIGTPDDCRARLRDFFDAGIDEVRLNVQAPDRDAYFAAIE